MQDDAELVRRCQEGDSTAFATLYERHRSAVRVVCRTNVTDDGVADDLVQETFARLWVSLPTFVGGANVLRWLRRTAKNLCIDHHRRRCNSEIPFDVATAEQAHVGPDPAMAVVTRHAVRNVLAKLRPVDAALLHDHHIAERPLREMAIDWGSSEKSLSVRLTRARRAFAAAGSDLRALLPLPLWLRLRWTGRSDAMGTTAAAASMGLLHVALAVLLAVPPAAAASDGHRVSATSQQQVLESKRLSGQEHAGRGTDRGEAQGRQPARRSRRGAETVKTRETDSGAAMAEIPGTKLRLHRELPERPDYHYQARVDAGPVATGAEVVVDNWDEGAAINEPACDAVAGAPAAATCSSDTD